MTALDRPLDPGYRVDAFDRSDPGAAADVMELWAREGAVMGVEAERRLAEVLLVGRTLAGEAVGVSSAYLQPHHQVGTTMWHYRVYVSPEHRMSNLGVQLGVRGRELLEQRFVDGTDVRAPGIIYEIENDELRRGFPGALWRQMQFTFIGEEPDGTHTRVHYFAGAEAPAPASVRTGGA